MEIAKNLRNDKEYHEVGRWRTAIGRAYYSAFLIIYKYLEEQGIKIEDRDRIHKEVIEKIGEEGFPKIKNKIDRLRSMRIDADYMLNEPIGERQCNSSISLSEIIIGLIKSFF